MQKVLTAVEALVIQALREAASYTRLEPRKKAYLEAAKQLKEGELKVVAEKE